jgi:hypothetical protein
VFAGCVAKRHVRSNVIPVTIAKHLTKCSPSAKLIMAVESYSTRDLLASYGAWLAVHVGWHSVTTEPYAGHTRISTKSMLSTTKFSPSVRIENSLPSLHGAIAPVATL